METHYIFYFVIIFLLFIIVSLGWFISFQVPENEDSREYLKKNCLGGLLAFFSLLFGLICVLVASFTLPNVVKFHAPFSQAGVFFVAISILLLSTFFIGDDYKGKRYDTHPLLFLTTSIFIILALITGVITNHKLYNS